MNKHFVIINKSEPDIRFRELGFASTRERAEKMLDMYKRLYKLSNLEIEEIGGEENEKSI